eukprot:GHVT01054803.1.p1 GENE.GHVT01054803.1~~GHVT01054803.1.p1  ORF type:complete len:249 (-),score=60.57 GHVT01054803.1:425-1171(-)
MTQGPRRLPACSAAAGACRRKRQVAVAHRKNRPERRKGEKAPLAAPRISCLRNQSKSVGIAKIESMLAQVARVSNDGPRLISPSKERKKFKRYQPPQESSEEDEEKDDHEESAEEDDEGKMDVEDGPVGNKHRTKTKKHPSIRIKTRSRKGQPRLQLHQKRLPPQVAQLQKPRQHERAPAAANAQVGAAVASLELLQGQASASPTRAIAVPTSPECQNVSGTVALGVSTGSPPCVVAAKIQEEEEEDL